MWKSEVARRKNEWRWGSGDDVCDLATRRDNGLTVEAMLTGFAQ